MHPAYLSNVESRNLYEGREQSQIKHFILEKYLEQFAIIIGKNWDEIVYVDCFSGPWKACSEQFKDTSFSIALNKLRTARDTVKKAWRRDLKIRCVFLEKDPAAFKELFRFSEHQKDVEIKVINKAFEAAVGDIQQEIQRAGKNKGFSFLFIDPTGWSGFSLNLIAPLLKTPNCEVLINFMMDHIKRFVAQDKEQKGFKKLFGDNSFQESTLKFDGQQKEDALVASYIDKVSSAGGYAYASSTLIPRPTSDRANFYLIYLTRHIKGLEVFKRAEKRALELTKIIRSDAKIKKREARSGQTEMFSGESLPDTSYIGKMQVHFETLSQKALEDSASSTPLMAYDKLYGIALRFPIVQESFLRQLIKTNDWKLINVDKGKLPSILQKPPHFIQFRESLTQK